MKTRITRLAIATGAMALALSMGAAANERDTKPESSSATTQSQPSSTMPSSTAPSSTAPSTTQPSSTTTAPPSTISRSPTSSSSTTSTAPTSSSQSATASNSGQATGRPFVQFKDLDTDNNRSITAAELSANTSVSVDLATYDSNKDGTLSESEYARYKNQMARNNPTDDADTMPEKR